MSKSGFFLDTKEFDAKFKKVTNNTIPSSYEKGFPKQWMNFWLIQ